MNISNHSRFCRLLILAVSLTLLAACGSSELPATLGSKAQARYFDQTITSFDGTPIAATVYVPALAAGETAPLILHGNGWADRRTRAPTELTYNPNNFYGDMHHGLVTRMWKAGYVVVTIDQRGWGDSGGEVRIMDPDKEIRDFRVVLDWAQAHLPVTQDSKGVLAGAVGGSYGGGFQILLAAQDARMRAISPWVSWNDLRYSLAPNNVLRSGHVSLLNAAGAVFAHLDPYIPRAYIEAQATNSVPEDVNAILYHHSPAELCAQGKAPKIDALIVQGVRDTLFDAAEGIANAECLLATGADVRFIAVPNGHIFNQQGIQADPTSSRCGRIDPFESVVAWYDEKLKGIKGAAKAVPKVCFPLVDDKSEYLADRIPIGGDAYSIPTTLVVSQPGNVQNSGMQFVPLGAALSSPLNLAGLPVLDATFTSINPAADPIVFIGIAVQKADGRRVLINDALLPLRGLGAKKTRLPGISLPLDTGDQLGLALYTSHGQYVSNSARVPFAASITGSISLPLHKP